MRLLGCTDTAPPDTLSLSSRPTAWTSCSNPSALQGGQLPDDEIVPTASGSRVAWWAGNGGSPSFADLDHRMSFRYASTRYLTGAHEMDRSPRLLYELYAAPGSGPV